MFQVLNSYMWQAVSVADSTETGHFLNRSAAPAKPQGFIKGLSAALDLPKPDPVTPASKL